VSDLAPLLLGALLVGVVWRMRMGLAAVLVAARTRAGPRPIPIAGHGVSRHRPGVSFGLAVMVIADVDAILLLPVHSWNSCPGPCDPSCRPAWLPWWFPSFGSPLVLFFFFFACSLSSGLLACQFPVPAPGLLNATSSHWVCTLRSGRRDRCSFEQGVRLSAGFQQNDSTTRLPKLASPSTTTKIALENPAAACARNIEGRGRMRRQCARGESCGREAGSLVVGEGLRAQAVRRQLRACDVVVSGDRARQSREDNRLRCKRTARNRARQRRLEDPVPARLARAEGVY
jgi:hypothetical protein